MRALRPLPVESGSCHWPLQVVPLAEVCVERTRRIRRPLRQPGGHSAARKRALTIRNERAEREAASGHAIVNFQERPIFERMRFSPSRLIVGGTIIVLLIIILTGNIGEVFWTLVDFTLRQGG